MKKLHHEILLENLIDKRGRIYDIVELMSETFGRKFYGEILNPTSESAVKLTNVSHTVDNIAIVNGNLVGDITILDTPMGDSVQKLISNGVKFTSSIRATGEVNNNYVSNLSITTFDLDVVMIWSVKS
jgi:hypothetical protein